MSYFKYIRRLLCCLGCILVVHSTVHAGDDTLAKVKLGSEVLADMGYKPILGKSIGLLTHAAGVNSQGIPTYKILREDPRVNLKALFSPEHGLFSKAEASQSIDHSQYRGIPVYSLHGKHRKPTPEMLKGIDSLLVDIQDIGVRSYTYISCLKLCMEACFEHGIEVMILDRPNPLGGLKVDGPIMEKQYMGYLGAFPVPYVYGLTIGELAHMTAKEPHWLSSTQKLKKPKKLSIIPMQGWKRSMLWQDTGLHWTATSPYIQDLCSVLGYATTGLGCQIGGFSHGIGTPYPFRLLSHPSLDAEALAQKLRALPIKGLSFKAITTQNTQGKAVSGVYIYLSNWKALRPTLFSFYLMPLACELKGINVFAKASAKDKEMFNKHVGCSLLWNSLVKHGKHTDIGLLAKEWDKQNQKFQDRSRKYYIYP